MTIHSAFSLNISPESFSSEDLICAISLGTMKKVAILSKCGHAFDKDWLEKYFENDCYRPCPLCRTITRILPSDEKIEKKIQKAFKRASLASRRSAMQAACDQYHQDLERSNHNSCVTIPLKVSKIQKKKSIRYTNWSCSSFLQKSTVRKKSITS